MAEPTSDEDIFIDPNIPLGSVAHLVVPNQFFTKRGDRRGNLALHGPPFFTKQSEETQQLRASPIWRPGGNRDDQVDQMRKWFTDFKPSSSGEPKHKKLKLETRSKSRARQQQPTASSYQTTTCPASKIGILTTLPGEIRNRIYRLALLQDEPISVIMPFRTCGIGPCLHSKTSYNIPAISQTCKQLRWESLPIYLAENPAFQFDAGCTAEGCVVNFLNSLGDYADLIETYIFTLNRPIWKMDEFVEYAVYRFTVTTPKKDGSGKFAVTQWEAGGRKICQCQVDALLNTLSVTAAGKPKGRVMRTFADSESWADFVWRAKKSKQWPQHLKKCKKCKEVVFNN